MYDDRAEKLAQEGDRLLAMPAPKGKDLRMYQACLARIVAAGTAYDKSLQLGGLDNAVADAVQQELKTRRKK